MHDSLEQRSSKPTAAGSSPAGGANKIKRLADGEIAKNRPLSRNLSQKYRSLRSVVTGALLLLSGCDFYGSTWTPSSYPVQVAVIGEVTEAEEEAVHDGTAVWADALGTQIFRVILADRRAKGRVNLAFDNGEVDPKGVGGTDEGEHSDFVHVKPDMADWMTVHVIAHELGHTIGMVHSKDPRSLMYPWAEKGQVIMPEDLADACDLTGVCK